ncbi:MAG: two-component system sensor kinase [Actinomycetia bacterium]|nr:two-component system sensor kinase [Actinomycetes bacterium]
MRRRLLIANLLLVVALLLVLEVPLGIIYSRYEHDSLNTALQRDAAALAALSGDIVTHPGEHDADAIARQFSAAPGDLVAIVDRTGKQLTRPSVLTNDREFTAVLRAARGGTAATGEIGGLIYVAVPLGAAGDNHGAVLVARGDEAIDHRVHQFWLFLTAFGAGLLGVSLLVSSRLTRWVVDPLRRLGDQASALGRGELTARAEPGDGPSEVVALAATFNEMADRLDELVTSQRRFVADASHQLRTPLTALRLRLESLDPDDPAAIPTVRDASLDETARLTRIVDGLLSLARAENRRSERESIDVGAVLADRQEAWEPLATENGVRLLVASNGSPPVRALIVPGHLEQILDNLIDNALDASPADGTVTLGAEPNGRAVRIHVTDHGPGMTSDERRRAFDPFWQSPDGNATGSTGLGLAIVEQLARGSQGTVVLEPADGTGLDAVITFAAAD